MAVVVFCFFVVPEAVVPLIVVVVLPFAVVPVFVSEDFVVVVVVVVVVAKRFENLVWLVVDAVVLSVEDSVADDDELLELELELSVLSAYTDKKQAVKSVSTTQKMIIILFCFFIVV